MSGVTITGARRGLGFFPSSQVFESDVMAIPENVEVVITIRRARSPKHLRFYFAKLRSVIQAGAWDGDTDSLLGFIKLGIGFVITIVDNASTLVNAATMGLAESLLQKHGPASDEAKLARFVMSLAGPKSFMVPKSISFEAISQDEFNDFDRRSDAFIAERFGLDPTQLRSRTADLAASELDVAGGPLEAEAIEPASAPATPEETAPEAVTPLDERLRAAAFELGMIEGGIEATNKYWEQMKQRQDLRSLDSRARDLLRELLAAAREKARGEISEKQFRAMVEKIAARAMPRSEAA